MKRLSHKPCTDFSYYAFGMEMPNRKYTASSSYRYGFNGQEKDDEVAGSGNMNTALYWEYDVRVGRRWNVDPKSSPSISDYACFSNNPIWFVDPLGDTVRTTRAFDNNKLKKSAYDLWAKSKAGKKFIKDYGVGGKYEKVAVVFDLGGDNWGQTETYAVDAEGKVRAISSIDDQENASGEDHKLDPGRNYGLKKGENLKFVIRMAPNGFDEEKAKDGYNVANDGLAIVHETQHVRHNHYDLSHYNYTRSAYISHTKLMNYGYFRERWDFMLEHSKMVYPQFKKYGGEKPYYRWLIDQANQGLFTTQYGYFGDCDNCDQVK